MVARVASLQLPLSGLEAQKLLLGRLVEKGAGSAGGCLRFRIAGAAGGFRGSGCYGSLAVPPCLFHGSNVGQDQRVEEKRRGGTEDLPLST